MAFRILIIPFSLLCFFLYLYFSVGLDKVGEVFSTLNYKYFVLAFVVCTIAMFLDHLRSYIARRHYQKKFPYLYEVHSILRSNFWEMLTPGTFAFGPINRVANMNKQGVPPSKGTIIMLYNGICWFSAWIIATLFFTFLNFHYFMSSLKWYLVIFYIIGLLVNFGTVFVYLYVPRYERFVMKLVRGVLNILRKLHIIRKQERYNTLLIKSEDQINKVKRNLSSLDYKWWEWVVCILLAILQIIFIYSTNYYSARALGVAGVDVWKFIGAFLIINSITVIFPIPGGLGVVDVALQLVLYPLFARSSVDVAYSVDFVMILSRIITYYYPLLLGAIALVIKVPTVKSGKCSICDGYTIIEESKKNAENSASDVDKQSENITQ